MSEQDVRQLMEGFEMGIVLWPLEVTVRFLSNVISHLAQVYYSKKLIIFGSQGGLGVLFFQVVFFLVGGIVMAEVNKLLPFQFVMLLLGMAWAFFGYIWRRWHARNIYNTIYRPGALDVFMSLGLGLVTGLIWRPFTEWLWPTPQLL